MTGDPPRTGLDGWPLIWPPPELPHRDPEYAEPLLEPEPADQRAAAIAELLKAETERLSLPQASLNRVVFDVPLPATSTVLQARTAAESAPPPPPVALASLPPRYTPQGENDATLVFESRFECGNLRRAVQTGPFEYDLLLRTDTKTTSHTRWFFFSVANTPGPQDPVTFNIVNMTVDGSLFGHGMRPLIYSVKARARDGASAGWRRTARRIYYYANGQRRRRQAMHTLTFTVDFSEAGDLCYFSFGCGALPTRFARTRAVFAARGCCCWLSLAAPLTGWPILPCRSLCRCRQLPLLVHRPLHAPTPSRGGPAARQPLQGMP